jgi:hypothetical protein
MIKGFVKSNVGLGFVSEICIDKNDNDIAYKNLNKFFPPMQYQLITKNGRKLNDLTQDFIKILTTTSNQ